MIKFKLKYGIELSLDSHHRSTFGPIEWFFPHIELEHFRDEIDRKINSSIGVYGHGVSSKLITAIDFLKVVKQLSEWNPVLIEGSELDGLIPSLELSDGKIH
jgi:hypothetical protein